MKPALFADNMVLYTEFLKNLPKTIRTKKQVQEGCRIQDQDTKSVVFLYTSIENMKMKLRKQFNLQ